MKKFNSQPGASIGESPLKGGRPAEDVKIIFQIDGGMGKCVAATAVCKAIKTQYPLVIGLYPYGTIFASPTVPPPASALPLYIQI